ncbi:penicillin-binding protein 1A [Mucilaginibacter sp.]|jgi:penicillin-binding protein 1A|uniref:penicillin-binding protein 1A n=1 Tax=Mucilaginibacter sp. TaxID=1882438 RepID=UPI002BF92EE4|nr:transglycosylase domain-containing protein [Mucilaginibacter sp.]HTI59806.1 transglycosylase domain-containing protein [Mucilaginibacter sp.]
MIVVKLSQQDIRRYNGYIWKFFITCFLLVVLLIVGTYFGIFGPLPSFRDLENPKSNQASEIISSDKQTLGTYYVENRSNVTYKEISPNVIHALVATEDERFYDHSGIDFRRQFTILFLNIFKSQGGSTITQQLAKNLFTEHPSRNKIVRFTQKMKEWITAVNLERRYTKEEIITMYLNKVDFGAYNTFGIKSAARTYFNTTPDKLTPDQAAMLIAMINGPGYYSPINHPDRLLNRRNYVVLTQMAKLGYLSEGQLAEFKAKPLGLHFNRITHNDGPAPYFRAVLKREVQKILEDESIVRADGTPYDLDRDGLKIYTTINYTMQQYAEEAQAEYMRQLQVQFNSHWKGYSLYKSIKNFKLLLDQGMHRSDRYKADTLQGMSAEEIKKDFNTPTKVELFTWKGDTTMTMKPIDSIVYSKLLLRNSMMSMDPTTGYIKAWVGGINFEHFKYDQVKYGTRQVGSTAKPFTYAVAIDNGYSPCLKVDNVPVEIDIPGQAPYSPRQSQSDLQPGAITLRTALAFSQNYVTAWVMKQIGPVLVMNQIKKMGITSEVPPYPSICLGSFNASVFDMTGAYSVFANHGIWTEPTFILRIEDKKGNVLYTHKPRVTQAMNEQTAYVMTYMLKGVIENGTGSRLTYKYGIRNPVGGKTGTTQDNSDGWFIGITPQLVTGVWTGCEDRDIHFRSTRLGEGANTALPIFAGFMKRVYANESLGIKKNVDFDPPKSPLTVTLDCSAYDQQQQVQNPASDVDKKLGF